MRDQLRKLARYPDMSVLVLGETGTGKELVARAIHELSGPGGQLVPVNCAAIPAELVESELFGHESGSFTGSRQTRRGLFEHAAGGTLFLDEVGEMTLGAQAKLLVLAFNKRAERIFGYDAGEVIGSQLDLLLPSSLVLIHRVASRSGALERIHVRTRW